MCQFSLKMAKWLWIRRFLNSVNVISLSRYYLPMEKSGALHSKKNPSYFLSLRILCAKFCWNWPSGCGKEDGNVKNLQTEGRAGKKQSKKISWALNSGELKIAYQFKDFFSGLNLPQVYLKSYNWHEYPCAQGSFILRNNQNEYMCFTTNLDLGWLTLDFW